MATENITNRSWGTYAYDRGIDGGQNRYISISASNNTVSFGNGWQYHSVMTWNKALLYISNISKYSKITLNYSRAYSWGLSGLRFGIFSNTQPSIWNGYNSPSGQYTYSDLQDSDSGSVTLTVPNNVTSAYIGFAYCDNSNYTAGDNGANISITSIVGTLNSYTVTLSKGTGISAVSPNTTNTITPGSSITIDATVSNGYTWKNWTGSSTLTNKQNTIKPSGNVSYTANATANTYTVTFNANGGTTPTASKNVTYNSTYGTLPTPSRTGYSFNGWYTATSGGTQKTSSSTYSTIGNSTLYAQWSPITYTITFNSNGGMGSMSNMLCSYDTEYNLTANTFTRKNYKFLGWATSASGDVVYTDKAIIKNLNNATTTITLYAVWQQQGIIQIMIENEYKQAQAYIYQDGFWLLAQPWLYSSGWKISSE